jgi:indole-3-acetate monooxygenase
MTIGDGVTRSYGDAGSEQLLARARELVPQLRSRSAEIERERRLPADVVETLREAGFMHALLPRDLGGLEQDPVASARIVEEIARGDGSAGWCVMLAAQSCGFAGFLPAEDSRLIWGNGGIVAGTARPIGRAVATSSPEEGFVVSGRWPFASGSSHATWFGAECILYDGEDKRRDASGNEVTRMLFVPASEVTIHDTWDTMGLQGTASNDFSIEHAFVPAQRGFQMLVTRPKHDWPLYRVEPLPFINHGSHSIGLARGALECAMDVAEKKQGWGGVLLREMPRLQSTIAEATALVGSASNYLYESSWQLWQQALKGGDTDPRLRATVRLANSHAVRASVQAVDMLHAIAGTSSVFASSPLARQFRDIHTASAHVMIGSMTFEAAGRVLMGMEPRFPFF